MALAATPANEVPGLADDARPLEVKGGAAGASTGCGAGAAARRNSLRQSCSFFAAESDNRFIPGDCGVAPEVRVVSGRQRLGHAPWGLWLEPM